MLDVHHINAFLLMAVAGSAGVAALIARRKGQAGRTLSHLLALAQTLVVGQVLLGLLLLAGHKRAHDQMHYGYGFFALIALFVPLVYSPPEPKARLLWFGVGGLLAALLGVRAYMTAA